MNNEKRMYFYERFANDFDSKMNMYDTNKRVSLVFDELLNEEIADKSLLDAGCGTGWFSLAAYKRGATVTAMDLGENLLSRVTLKAPVKTKVGSIMEIPFSDNTFDYIVSSEVIEHTPDPKKSIKELCRVLKPGGKLVITTPNKFWYFSIWIANKLKLRPYQGLENWISWNTLSKEVSTAGCLVEKKAGIHLFPFIHSSFYPVLNYFHRHNTTLYPIMVNMAIKVVKPK